MLTKFILLGRAMKGIFMTINMLLGIQSLVLLSAVSLRCTFYSVFHWVVGFFSLGPSIALKDSSRGASFFFFHEAVGKPNFSKYKLRQSFAKSGEHHSWFQYYWGILESCELFWNIWTRDEFFGACVYTLLQLFFNISADGGKIWFCIPTYNTCIKDVFKSIIQNHFKSRLQYTFLKRQRIYVACRGALWKLTFCY